MKTFVYISIFLFLIFLCLFSCNVEQGPEYLHNWKVQVYYLNGEQEVLKFTQKSQANTLRVEITETEVTTCLKIIGYYNGMTRANDVIIACGVRRFEVVSADKKLAK